MGMAMRSAIIFIYYLVVTVMTISVAESQNPIGSVHVNGTLYCTSNGNNANASPVFPGAAVEVACSADVIAYSQANVTTNSNGVYLVLLLPRPSATVSSIVSSCRLFVQTPLSACNPALPSAGLVSNLRFVKTVPVGFWSSTYLVATGFTLLQP